MKVTVAWNVWNNYIDSALASEILRLENQEKGIFDELCLISQGGYPKLPSKKQSQYLDGHFHVDCPDVPMLKVHPKFTGIYRVFEGIQRAYIYAEKKNHDFVISTNADAWILSIEKTCKLLQREEMKEAAVAARIGLTTGLEINYGSCVPSFDDHFMILNVNECRKYGVFDYDHSVRFFYPHFGLFGIHYILSLFVDQRVPKGKFYAYSHLEDAIGQYGDYCGFNLIPWQYEITTGFLHANCAQVPALNKLRAAMLKDFGFTKYPLVLEYFNEISPNMTDFKRRHGVFVNKKNLKRKGFETLYWVSQNLYQNILYKKYKKRYSKNAEIDVSTLAHFDKFRHVKPVRFQG